MTNAKSKAKAAGPATKGVRVQARNEKGIRRAGRHWGAAPEDVALSDLTPEQLEALREEPALLVTDIDMPEPEKTEPAKT